MAGTPRFLVKHEKENPPQTSTKKSSVRKVQPLTRSQSRELNDGVDLGLPNDRSGKLVRGLGDDKKDVKQNTPNPAPTSRRRDVLIRNRCGGYEYLPTPGKIRGAELPTVSEEPSRKSPRRDLGDTIPETGESHQFAPDSTEDHVNISGTTILGNDSFDASENLDPSLMLEVLPELLQASTNLLDFLVPSKLSEEELTEWTSRLQQGKLSAREKNRLTHRASVFETNKKCFGSHTYIDISSVTRAFTANVEDDIQGMKPILENVLHKANIASLAASVAHTTEGHSSEKLLLDLRSSFPLPFMRPSSHLASEETIAEETFLGLTFDLGLDIRTQSLILSLASQNIEDTLVSDTPQNEGQPPVSVHQRLIDDHFEVGDSTFLPDNNKDDLHQRTAIIENSLLENVETSLDQLRGTFPWKSFIIQLLVWIRLRIEKINSGLSSQGSLDDMVDQLQEALDSQKVAEKSSELSQPLPQPLQQQEDGSADEDNTNGEAAPRRSSPYLSDSEVSQRRTYNWAMLNASSMRLLRRRENKEDDTSHEIELEAAGQNRSRKENSPADSWETCVNTSEPETQQGPSGGENLRRARKKQKKPKVNGRTPATASRNLGPTFIDPQEDAQRVSPISLEDSAQRQKHKRLLPELSDVEEAQDDSGSEAYQQDERRVDIEQNKKRKPKGISPPRKRRALGGNSPNGTGRQRQNSRAMEQTASPHPDRRSVSSFEPDNSEDSRAQSREPNDYERARQQARLLTAARTSERKNQTRRKWSDEEVQRLIKLVGKVGTSWSLIKQKDEAYADRDGEPKLTERNQVQLKDKARNMVVEFYKSNRPLPKNFDRVHISQKQVEQLAQLGVEYP